MRQILINNTPGLARLVKQIEHEAQTGWIKCLDGGYARVRSSHAALNTKLQSAGSIVMKQTSIFIDQRVTERGIDSLKVLDVHDEGQHDVDPKAAKEFGELAVQALLDAGEELGVSAPTKGEYKIGNNWSETH